MTYRPDPVGTPKSFEEFMSYIQREFEKISTLLGTGSTAGLQEYFREPEKKTELMQVVADGTAWNPTNEGRGIYVWAGGQWNLVRQLPPRLQVPTSSGPNTEPESNTPTEPFDPGNPVQILSLLPGTMDLQKDEVKQLTLTLNMNAPAGGVVIQLANNLAAACEVPASIAIGAGSSGVSFTVRGLAAGDATITAGYNGTSASSLIHCTEPVVEEPGGGTGGGEPLQDEVIGVPTFHCMGLYWKPGSHGTPGASGVFCRYRETVGPGAWKNAYNLWFDPRNLEARGSIVYLDHNTEYEWQVSLDGTNWIASGRNKTWNEDFPIGSTVELDGSTNAPLVITEGGTATAYKRYKAKTLHSYEIDVQNNNQACIEIRAPYVIVEGFVCKGAQKSGIEVFSGARTASIADHLEPPNVIIQNCDISGWGRISQQFTDASGWGVSLDGDAGIQMGNTGNGTRAIVIQYNHIHDPRYGASSWDNGHPKGNNAIMMTESGQHNVIRYNKIGQSTDLTAVDAKPERFFMDAIGGGENFSLTLGFPGPNSDIYGNDIRGTLDDGIEAEGSGRNVRIWNNYTDYCTVGVGTTGCHEGPIYVWRNVHDQARTYWILRSWDNDTPNYAYKTCRFSTNGVAPFGRRHFFHNTLLQRPPSGVNGGTNPANNGTQHNLTRTRGHGQGLSSEDGLNQFGRRPLENTVSRNNIYHNYRSSFTSIWTSGGTLNDFDYDLCYGPVNADEAQVGANVLQGVTPIYATGNGPGVLPAGNWRLDATSDGYEDGQAVNNFSDGFTGAAPDRGACDHGAKSFVYGVDGRGNGKLEPL